MKLQLKYNRKHYLSKTQPDQTDLEIRASLGEEAKQRLRDISCISNLAVSRSRDWTLDQIPSIKLSTIEPAIIAPRPQRKRLDLKTRELDRIRRMNRTQGSVREHIQDSQRKVCNPVTMDFAQIFQEKRIHSSTKACVEFDNTSLTISDKAMKNAALKMQGQLGKTHFIFQKKPPKLVNQRSDRVKTPLPHRKLAVKSSFVTNSPIPPQKTSTSFINKQFSLTKEFLDLRMFLMEERKSIFYPIKPCLSVKPHNKIKGKGFY